MKKIKIVVTAGGTGGHVFPASAVANKLASSEKYDVMFMTDSRGMRYLKDGVLNKKIRVKKVLCAALGGKGKLGKLWALMLTALGCDMAFFKFMFWRPKAVIGFGGYGIFPATVAGKIWGAKILLHEQNSVFGKTNRIAAHFADKALLSFKNTKMLVSHLESIYTGQPVRKEFEYVQYPEIKKVIRIFITGGSQGAKMFDQFADILINVESKLKHKIEVSHQVPDPEQVKKISKKYKDAGIKATVSPFFVNIADEIKNAHLIISRSGASVFELLTIGRPAFFIPLKIAADNHQQINAEELVKIGAAEMILEKDFTKTNVEKILLDLLGNEKKVKDMASKAKLTINATDNIVKEIEKIL